MRFNNVIYLQNHFANLSGQLELLFLRIKSFINSLGLHIVSSISEAVYSEVRVAVLLLLGLQVGEVLNSGKSRVLSKGNGHLIEGISEGSDGVLVSSGDLN